MKPKRENVGKKVAVLDCDIEINKYQISMALSLTMPFLLSFASVGIATTDNTTKFVFLSLSIFMFFVLATIVFIDSRKLISKYRYKRELIEGLPEDTKVRILRFK